MKFGIHEIVVTIITIVALIVMVQIAGQQTRETGELLAGAASVDLEQIQKKLDSGELSSHEADFYIPVIPESDDTY